MAGSMRQRGMVSHAKSIGAGLVFRMSGGFCELLSFQREDTFLGAAGVAFMVRRCSTCEGARGSYIKKPRFVAILTACVRSDAPSFNRIFCMWAFTVASEMERREAIILL